MSSIESEGHRNWVPLPMDVDPEEIARELRRRFGPPAGTQDEVVELNLSAAQGIATNLQRQAGDLEQQGTVTCAAWILTLDPGRLEIRAVAIMRATAVDASQSTDELVQEVVGDQPRRGDPVVEPFDTWSGEAYRIRFRPIVTVDGEDEVHQVNAVLWPRQEQETVFLLSSYVEGLIEANEVGDLLDELAAGTRGI